MADEKPQPPPAPENQDKAAGKPQSPSNQNTTRDITPHRPNSPVNLHITNTRKK
jgi:hypothetical protein